VRDPIACRVHAHKHRRGTAGRREHRGFIVRDPSRVGGGGAGPLAAALECRPTIGAPQAGVINTLLRRHAHHGALIRARARVRPIDGRWTDGDSLGLALPGG